MLNNYQIQANVFKQLKKYLNYTPQINNKSNLQRSILNIFRFARKIEHNLQILLTYRGNTPEFRYNSIQVLESEEERCKSSMIATARNGRPADQ